MTIRVTIDGYRGLVQSEGPPGLVVDAGVGLTFSGSSGGAGEVLVAGGDGTAPSWRSSQVSTWTEEVTRTAPVTGTRSFFLPWGCYMLAAPGIAEVTLNGVLLSPETDWQYCTRGGTGTIWPQPTTADASCGVWLSAGTEAGDTVKIRWLTGAVNMQPPSPIAVWAPGGILYVPPGWRSPWRYGGTGQRPSSIAVAQRAGLSVEMWRLSKKQGQGHINDRPGEPSYPAVHGGRRYTPWYRFPVATESGEAIVDVTTLGGGNGSPRRVSHVYRLCYYDPATGARSSLSSERIRYVNGGPDRQSPYGTIHVEGSAWVGS